jgi:hypothetical protein
VGHIFGNSLIFEGVETITFKMRRCEEKEAAKTYLKM